MGEREAMTGGSCAHCGLPVPGGSGEAYCCAGCRLVHELLEARRDAPGLNAAFVRVGLGVFFAFNVMAFSFAFYGVEVFGAEGVGEEASLLDGLLRWLLLALTGGVMATLWVPQAEMAAARLREGAVSASLLIALGVLGAFVLSAASVLRGSGPMYFDSASAILLLVTVGQFLEARMKSSALRSASATLLSLPDEAAVERNGRVERVVPETVALGERVIVASGQAIPVDGRIVSGEGSVEEAMLTGEAAGRAVRAGDEVWAGTILSDGAVTVEATEVGSGRRMAVILDALRHSMTATTATTRLADRAAAIFVPLVLAVATVCIVVQLWQGGGVEEGVSRALAVALIACPCALGLAGPLAISRVSSALAARGIVVRSAAGLERAGRIRVIAFDKTGTLTTGRLRVDAVARIADAGVDPIEAAAALERYSAHPAARAIVEAAHNTLHADEVRTLDRRGMRGRINGADFVIEPLRADEDKVALPDAFDELHPIVLRLGDRPVAVFGLREELRRDAPNVLKLLRSRGLSPIVLTGDASPFALSLSEALGVPVEVGMSPEVKRGRIRSLQSQRGEPVAFVGDGVNDAPALAAADLGVAVARGSDLAHAGAAVSLLREGLEPVVELIDASRHLRRRIVLSLSWAFGYNTIGVTAAAAGLLTPVIAALLMAGSSLVVIAIATRPLPDLGAEPDVKREISGHPEGIPAGAAA